MAEATYLRDSDTVRITAPAVLTNGEVIQLADGRAGVVPNTGAGVASGERADIQIKGVFTVAKTTSVVMLDGQELWWVESTGKCSYTGDFRIGVAVGDATAAATTIAVDLNVAMVPILDPMRDETLTEQTEGGFDTGLGLQHDGGTFKMAVDAVAEIAMQAVRPKTTIALGKDAIFEAWLNVVDNGDAADTLDVNIGLANGTHATDFESITEFVAIHIDSNVLNILAHSDDGTTDVPPTDTTVDYVEGTPFFIQIDTRNEADIQIYINGVNVLPATVFTLAAATGPLFGIMHCEKASNDTLYDVRGNFWVRTLTRV